MPNCLALNCLMKHIGASRALCIVGLAILLVGEAAATRVFHQPLEAILTRGTPVVKARVVSSKVEIGANVLSVYVQIDNVEQLRGDVGRTGTVVYRYSTILERIGPDGKSMRVSPIRDGSGIEQDLRAGSDYFLILDDSGRQLIRAEELTLEPEVRTLLGL